MEGIGGSGGLVVDLRSRQTDPRYPAQAASAPADWRLCQLLLPADCRPADADGL